MTYRLCPHLRGMCKCSDAEMQVCLSALVAKYLKGISYIAKRNVAPENSGICDAVRNEVMMITRSFGTLDAMRRWMSELNK